MAGLSHTALRRLAIECGGRGGFFTEMLSARGIEAESQTASPYLRRSPEETPLIHQLLVGDADEARHAAEVLSGRGADGIDINCGCPAPLVRKRGAGSWLMEVPETARAIIGAARKGAGELPLSVKIRLGETLDEGRLKSFCTMLEGEGVDLITVHARLRGEPYGRKPRWEWIGKVKRWVGIPVVGNGSIFSVDDARACFEQSGCDAVMIGRGAAVRPWLMGDICRELFDCEGGQFEAARPLLYRRFVELLIESFRPERRLGRLKEFTAYFASTYPFGHNMEIKVQNAATLEEALSRAEEFFKRAEEGFDGWGGWASAPKAPDEEKVP